MLAGSSGFRSLDATYFRPFRGFPGILNRDTRLPPIRCKPCNQSNSRLSAETVLHVAGTAHVTFPLLTFGTHDDMPPQKQLQFVFGRYDRPQAGAQLYHTSLSIQWSTFLLRLLKVSKEGELIDNRIVRKIGAAAAVISPYAGGGDWNRHTKR